MSNIPSLKCRSCGATELRSVIDLGRTPLANALLTAEQLKEPEAAYPLEVVFCPACTLVQITETVPPEQLFREYFYLSSFSDTLLRHAEAIAGELKTSRHLDGDSLVIEIASNDGYLLQYYKQAGVPVLGIEPATNIAWVAQEERGIPTLSEFFGPALAGELSRQGKRADIIHANNVLAHVADLNGFVSGLASLLRDDGVAVIEVPYVKDMIDRTEFDTIYHEHLCYFSLTALEQLFRRHGLAIQHVERLAIHGGTLRLYAVKESAARKQSASSSALELLANEKVWAGEFEYYRGFQESVDRLRNDLTSLLRDLKAAGNKIAVYGASAKGTTLLNYFGIGAETLDYVVDRSTAKQGYYTPGTHLPIYAPEHLLETMPDHVLLLTWNFAAEILQQQSEYRRRGGRFIIPIPQVQVVEPNANAWKAPAG